MLCLEGCPGVMLGTKETSSRDGETGASRCIPLLLSTAGHSSRQVSGLGQSCHLSNENAAFMGFVILFISGN